MPVEPGTEDQWQQRPFAGHIAEGFVWGRGAIDNKSAVVGTLEAVEMLLAEGFQPARTVYLAYGHDEEGGGTHGAARIAELLKTRGVQREMVADEAGVIGDRILPASLGRWHSSGSLKRGSSRSELSTRIHGGHSSVPPRHTAVGVLSAAVAQAGTRSDAGAVGRADTPLFERTASQFKGACNPRCSTTCG